VTESDVMAPNPARNGKRPWPVVAVLLLLVGQIAGFIALFVWRVRGLQASLGSLTAGEKARLISGDLVFPVGLLIVAIVAIAAVLSLLRHAENAWANAMFVQTLDLALALVLYFSDGSFYAYLMMVYGVFVVVYLLIPGVQAAFLPPGGPDDH
jgi:uncharacterized membrane protein